MKPFAFTLAAALIAAACTACSQGQDQPPQPQAQAPATPTIAATTGADTDKSPADNAAPVVNENSLYFDDLLKRPDFSKAFASLSGAAALPVWAREGGTASPVQTVQAEGKSMLLADACKPHDCPSERILVLYDEHSQAMWGVFVHHPEGLTPTANSDDHASDQLTWLGGPSDSVKHLLQEKLNSRE